MPLAIFSYSPLAADGDRLVSATFRLLNWDIATTFQLVRAQLPPAAAASHFSENCASAGRSFCSFHLKLDFFSFHLYQPQL